MASDLEKQAKEAFIDDHFELAVDLYTQAIDLNPNSAELFAERAQANIKLNNFTGLLLSLSFPPFRFRAFCFQGLTRCAIRYFDSMIFCNPNF
jgi:tetratricopeptide (TPR) repeat protein